MQEKRFKTVVIVGLLAIFITVTGLAVAFANYSQELKINGVAKVSKTKWEVKFANLSNATTTGEVDLVTVPTLQLDDTYIGDYSVTFEKPNSSISYTFDVVNNGTFDAKLSTLTIPTPICTGTGNNADVDAKNVCDNLTYTLTKADGTAFAVNEVIPAGETGNSVSLKLTLSYGDVTDASKLPVDDVSISNLQIVATYIPE